jgi:hypothetical protein
MRIFLRAAGLLLAVSLFSPRVSAQTFESVGTRAQGMAGAFVAVADDATATWWNPAGLASGALFSAALERQWAREPNQDTTLGVSFTVPSLGLSYYRLRTSAIRPNAAATQGAGNSQLAGTPLPTFVVHELGATFGQSVGNHLVLASTVRLLRADQTTGDIDLGGMVRLGVTRIGLVVKHLHEPGLTADGNQLTSFDRQVRVGAAYVPHPGKITVNAAFDADLTRTSTPYGDVRHLAGGAELWLQRVVGVRGGLSVNTVDDARPAGSAGVSVAVQRGVFVDAQITRGDDPIKEGWGVDFRVAF